MSELEKFLEERSKIPIPSGNVARVKLLAKELAMGVHQGLWTRSFSIIAGRHVVSEQKRFFEKRWEVQDAYQMLEVLIGHGYAEISDNSNRALTQAAFDLLDETEPYNVFISYKRSESSAFALLVLARLKEHNLVPFVDMALEVGGNWHADLEERIRDCDYFIILLGKDTLSSEMTVKEIQWALKHTKTIIPLWHRGFDLNTDKWAEINNEVKDAIQETNAIRVADKSASGYNNAIAELLNRFGVTP